MLAPPRPDPAQGLFETLLVEGGRPVELDAHLARLAASLETGLGIGLPPSLAALIGKRCAGLRLGRLRVTVSGGDTGPLARLATEAVDPAQVFPAWEDGAALQTLSCRGGLGAHKWADRARLAGVAAPAVALLVDGPEVLEAGRANVFAVFGETLLTPAADGRILPGIARAGAIAAAREEGIEVVEGELRRERLLAADEVFLTGSVRGVEPARSLDGKALPVATGVSRLVGAGLRRRWGLASAAAGAPEPAAAPPLGRPGR